MILYAISAAVALVILLSTTLFDMRKEPTTVEDLVALSVFVLLCFVPMVNLGLIALFLHYIWKMHYRQWWSSVKGKTVWGPLKKG